MITRHTNPHHPYHHRTSLLSTLLLLPLLLSLPPTTLAAQAPSSDNTPQQITLYPDKFTISNFQYGAPNDSSNALASSSAPWTFNIRDEMSTVKDAKCTFPALKTDGKSPVPVGVGVQCDSTGNTKAYQFKISSWVSADSLVVVFEHTISNYAKPPVTQVKNGSMLFSKASPGVKKLDPFVVPTVSLNAPAGWIGDKLAQGK